MCLLIFYIHIQYDTAAEFEKYKNYLNLLTSLFEVDSRLTGGNYNVLLGNHFEGQIAQEGGLAFLLDERRGK